MDLALAEIGPVFTGGEPGEQHLQATGPAGSVAPSAIRTGRAGWWMCSTPRPMPRRCWPPLARRPGCRSPARLPSGGIRAGLGVIGLGPNGDGHLRRGSSPRPDGDGCEGPGRGLHRPCRQCARAQGADPLRPALAISDLQAVDRDFAFVVDAKVEALTAVNAALGADKALIESVRVFDQFTGEKAEAQMGAGKKSIALTVRLQPTTDPDRGRDRGGQRQDRRQGDQGHRRDAAGLTYRASRGLCHRRPRACVGCEAPAGGTARRDWPFGAGHALRITRHGAGKRARALSGPAGRA
jgi:hypothetical protein